MPKHREVPALQDLCLKGVGSLVVHLAPSIITKIRIYKEPQKIIANLQSSLGWINRLLSTNVPFYLYDKMAEEVLQAVKELIEKTKKTYYPNTSMATFLTEMNVVVSLTEVVLNPSLRNIDFSHWPKIMRYVLYKNLHNLTGLEVLNLGSCCEGWRTSEYDRCLLKSLALMKNLKSLCLCFDSTDVIVQTIGDNCPKIQCLDFTSSRSVTDRSIPFLLKCKELRELQLHQTSVTTLGLVQLIIGLPKLQNIVVTVDLTDGKLVTNKPKLAKLKCRLETLDKFTAIVSWRPPTRDICPSSIAKYLSDLGYIVKVSTPIFSSHTTYSVKVPLAPFEKPDKNDILEFFEWLGMIALEGDLDKDDPSDYVSSYVTPEPNVETGQVRCLQFRGYFEVSSVKRIIGEYMRYNETIDKPWIAIYVQGFSDSPVSWGNEESHFYTNGDNGYCLIFNKVGGLICSHRCSKKRYK